VDIAGMEEERRHTPSTFIISLFFRAVLCSLHNGV
jgi:hypothetical protein